MGHSWGTLEGKLIEFPRENSIKAYLGFIKSLCGFSCTCVADLLLWLSKYDSSFQMILVIHKSQSLNINILAKFWRCMCKSGMLYMEKIAKKLVNSQRIYSSIIWDQIKCLHGHNPKLRSGSILDFIWGFQSSSPGLSYLTYLKRIKLDSCVLHVIFVVDAFVEGQSIVICINSRATFKRQFPLTTIEAGMSPSWRMDHSNGFHFSTEWKVKSVRHHATYTSNLFHK